MREAKVYENNLYNCDVRSAENLEKIYATRKDWLNGAYNYNRFLNKNEISELLSDNLIAIEGLEEINEEDVKKLG